MDSFDCIASLRLRQTTIIGDPHHTYPYSDGVTPTESPESQTESRIHTPHCLYIAHALRFLVFSMPTHPSPAGGALADDTQRWSLSAEAPHAISSARQRLLNHSEHPDCPKGLLCLSEDTGGRPKHTLPVIVRCAILGSPEQRLTLRDIYDVVQDRYSYYRTAKPSWKVRLSSHRHCSADECILLQDSVRHLLSLYRMFKKQPRPVQDPGFGSYWTVDISATPGTKRPRKRGRQTRIFERNASPRVDCRLVSPEAVGFLPPFQPSSAPPRRCVGEDGNPSHGELTNRRSHSPFYDLTSFDEAQLQLEPLRRQVQSLQSANERLTEQLAMANAEACRAKAGQRIAEGILADERRMREDEFRVREQGFLPQNI